ncbi:isoleucine--tRNA ligase [Candidatus Dependentiae bacterium]
MAENQEKDKKENKASFKDTLNLPTTDFPIRPNAKENDPKMLERWESEDICRKTFDSHKGREKFILHDGPPYANGHLHLGHAYNKILKDIVTKSQRMMGKHVPVTPGWDCHGLPIELNVTKENPGLSKKELKTKCREYAQKWVDIQRREFEKLGVFMDWNRPYLTMNYGYEASIIRAFGKFVADGYIERKNKTVAWCHSCETVLATAEIEYKERKDPSVYVQFPLDEITSKKLFPDIVSNKTGEISLLIWTTTPWTLPLNRAVIVKPKEKYVILNIKDKYVIVGKSLAEKLCAKIQQACDIVHEFDSDILSGVKVNHPFVPNLQVPIIFDPFVAMDEGTACVHCAPGCGPEDYNIALKNNLEIFSPLGSDGKYTDGIEPKELAGMHVDDGQIWVIRKLAELDKMLYKASMRHSYPHCWRCRKGLMFRATKQWFCDLSHNDLKQRAVKACDAIGALPEKSINRLKATIESRLEWCLSRQRVWGVPIVALICNKCDTSFANQAFIDNVAKQVEEKGVEYWDEVKIDDIIPPDITCEKCGHRNFSKETDILDVWFDAGVSHYAVLSKRKDLGYPADLYLEGKDQHRGWFQSSLLTSLVLQKVPCMKFIVTHGFTVDKKGRKMSKSLGNVVAPQELIDKLGTDGLRLWVSSIDCQGEAIVSDALLKNVQEVFRKIRNTARFLLSNLYDFDIKHDAIDLDKMLLIDKHALEELYKFNKDIIISYDNFDFTAVFHKLADYTSVELSSFYLDIIKDRLYVEKSDGRLRRSAQTACWYILDTLTRLIAPVLSFTAEQISDNYQKDKKESIHLQDFSALHVLWDKLCDTTKEKESPALQAYTQGYCETKEALDLMQNIAAKEEIWDVIRDIRSAVLKAIETQREKQVMRHSLEASVTVYFDLNDVRLSKLHEFYDMLDKCNQDVISFFKEFMIVSEFKIAEDDLGLEYSGLDGMSIKVTKAPGDKCPRCWNWSVTDHEHKLCPRCQGVLKK